MEAPGRVELPTRSLGNLGIDATGRNINELEVRPVLQANAK
jgi:hypothetical protein